MTKIRVEFSAATFTLLGSLLLFSAAALAAPFIYGSEGVSGEIDIKDRNPTLSFSKEVLDGSSRILVDVSVKNKGYEKYPIKVEYFINNNLVSTQIVSKELPGSLGLTLSNSNYPIPYNYTIVASLMTPNRTFTTTTYGSVDGTELSASLGCTLTINADGDSGDTFSASSVSIQQSDESSLTLKFTATGDTGQKEVMADLSTSGHEATGTLTLGDTTMEVSGMITSENGNLSALEVQSSSGTTSLACE